MLNCELRETFVSLGPLRVRDSGRIEKGDNVFADEVKWRNRQLERDNVLQYACCTEEAAQRISDIVVSPNLVLEPILMPDLMVLTWN